MYTHKLTPNARTMDERNPSLCDFLDFDGVAVSFGYYRLNA